MNAPTMPIERLTAFPADFDQRYRAALVPVVISGSVADMPVSQWTPEFFKSQFGEVETAATVQLPESGVIYLSKEKAHRRTLKVREFIELMDSGACCYIDQADISRFPGLAEACPVDTLLPTGRRFINLWIGARTRSGLHYDSMDNFLVQIFGDKTAILAAPSDRKALYPFGDNIAKSRIDPENLDAGQYPRASEVTFWVGVLRPGDLLYIPRGWWHFLRAPDRSISMNLWHEPAMKLADELVAIRELGPRVWGRIARDFIWHGLMRQRFERRLYSPPPTGKILYDLLAMKLSGQLFRS